MKQELMARVVAGLPTGTPVAWAVAPRNSSVPRVVLWQIGGTFELAVDGVTGMQTALVQIDCWGRSYAQAVDTGSLVYAQLAGWSSKAAKIHAVLPQSVRDFEPNTDVDELLFRRSLDFDVAFWQ